MATAAEHIRIRGVVQGVGFRPTVARLARSGGLHGFVCNDPDGVLIALSAGPARCTAFIEQLMAELPPLARVDSIERHSLDRAEATALLAHVPFQIQASRDGRANTAIAADAGTCAECSAEIQAPHERRYRYPFTTCTNCGPRFSITVGIPYDRARTTLAPFTPCARCQQEYDDDQDRRYHAETIACPRCGPRVRLLRLDHASTHRTHQLVHDAVLTASALMLAGAIIAVKGIGGYQLCCNATDHQAVGVLRDRKRRPHKALAMMARDLSIVARYAQLNSISESLLTSPEAPIVLLPKKRLPPKENALSPAVAPDQRRLGFMLPYSPLHQLLLSEVTVPIICTSGNFSDDPSCIDDGEALEKLSHIADWLLTHDRPIAHRVDDSLATVVEGRPRLLRRARGYSPSRLPLPEGFDRALELIALGGDLKAAAALSQAGQVVLGPHAGDLSHQSAREAFEHSVLLLADLLQHKPRAIAVDLHPEYSSGQQGRRWSEEARLPLYEIQHHHAHIAACLVENNWPLHAPAVLGIALDGVGYGADGALWGGEFLYCNYQDFVRLATFKPVALLGGDRAARQPWRNLYAHLRSELSWEQLRERFGDIATVRQLQAQPIALLDSLLESGLNSPQASSAGRLFDAAAAALGLFSNGVSYEGQAAMALEALVDDAVLVTDDDVRYPITIATLPRDGLPYLQPLGLWCAMLTDIQAGLAHAQIATRFHRSLAEAIVRMARRCRDRPSDAKPVETVALSGGVFQNQVLFSLVHRGLVDAGFTVLSHHLLPPNDGCLAVGQVAIASARCLLSG